MDAIMPEDIKRCFNIDINSDKFYGQHGVKCHSFSRSDRDINGDQINGITSFIDGSQVYGSDITRADKLRLKSGGRLRENDCGPTVPTHKQCDMRNRRPDSLVCGDVRCRVQPTLVSLQSMFLLEHNRLAGQLKARLGGLLDKMGEAEGDELLYQEARRLLGAQLQNIVYREWLPLVLGQAAIREHGLLLGGTSTYNNTANPSIRNEFSTVAFRFGHSLIADVFQPVGHRAWPLKFHYFETDLFVQADQCKAWQHEIAGVIRQPSPPMDTCEVESTTDFLFCEKNKFQWGDDLASRNIQRGRDHGIPGYNELRQFCGLEPIDSMGARGRPREIPREDWARLASVYTHPAEIDGFPGGLAETALEGGLVGPTFACILAKQFQALKEGDRYFFSHPAMERGGSQERGLEERVRDTVEGITLADIVCANTDNIQTTKDSVFKTGGLDVACSARQGLDFDVIGEEIIKFYANHSNITTNTVTTSTTSSKRTKIKTTTKPTQTVTIVATTKNNVSSRIRAEVVPTTEAEAVPGTGTVVLSTTSSPQPNHTPSPTPTPGVFCPPDSTLPGSWQCCSPSQRCGEGGGTVTTTRTVERG